MASISSGANGPWSSPATWTGGVVPGPLDDVTIVGHTVAVDQDIDIKSLQATSTGYALVTGSVPHTINISGTLSRPATLTSLYMILFDSGFTAENFTINANITQAQASPAQASIIRFAGSSGSVNINIATLQGKALSSGNNPSVISVDNLIDGDTSTALNISFDTMNFGYSYVIDLGANGTGTVSSSINLNPSTSDWSAAGQNNGRAINMGTAYIGTITINANVLLAGVPTLFIFGVTTPKEPPTIIVDGSVTGNVTIHSMYTYLLSGNARVIVNGDLTTNYNAAISGASYVRINGNLSRTPGLYTSFTHSLVTIITASSGIVEVTGDVSIVSPGIAVAQGSGSGKGLLIVGSAGGTSTITESDSATLTANMSLVLRPDCTYIMKKQTDANWPGDTTNTTTLSKYGEGPSVDNVKSGVVYGDIHVGEYAIPDKQSVRAGVATGAEVGEALLDIADLANITGGQVATLTE